MKIIFARYRKEIYNAILLVVIIAFIFAVIGMTIALIIN